MKRYRLELQCADLENMSSSSPRQYHIIHASCHEVHEPYLPETKVQRVSERYKSAGGAS